MALRYLLFFGCAMLCACQNPSGLQAESLMHHHWQLELIDQQRVMQDKRRPIDIEIGEHLMLNGHTGCNQFFGQGVLQLDKLQVNGLGMTRQACPIERRWIETAILNTLREGGELQLTQDRLFLKGSHHTLIYRLADWMS
jgi:heat shock protein HslJ